MLGPGAGWGMATALTRAAEARARRIQEGCIFMFVRSGSDGD